MWRTSLISRIVLLSAGWSYAGCGPHLGETAKIVIETPRIWTASAPCAYEEIASFTIKTWAAEDLKEDGYLVRHRGVRDQWSLVRTPAEVLHMCPSAVQQIEALIEEKEVDAAIELTASFRAGQVSLEQCAEAPSCRENVTPRIAVQCITAGVLVNWLPAACAAGAVPPPPGGDAAPWQ